MSTLAYTVIFAEATHGLGSLAYFSFLSAFFVDLYSKYQMDLITDPTNHPYRLGQNFLYTARSPSCVVVSFVGAWAAILEILSAVWSLAWVYGRTPTLRQLLRFRWTCLDCTAIHPAMSQIFFAIPHFYFLVKLWGLESELRKAPSTASDARVALILAIAITILFSLAFIINVVQLTVFVSGFFTGPRPDIDIALGPIARARGNTPPPAYDAAAAPAAAPAP
ncbi:hypothetical protein F5Y16DRAFT_418640 [Xylariaceae sp. FL0255]|nr:hypothetical protein F5Y16DRAFT_418640 [Xylariaceae sp. FL0255]